MQLTEANLAQAIYEAKYGDNSWPAVLAGRVHDFTGRLIETEEYYAQARAIIKQLETK